jgi:selenocysteine lyase/cysteine desulfurase
VDPSKAPGSQLCMSSVLPKAEIFHAPITWILPCASRAFMDLQGGNESLQPTLEIVKQHTRNHQLIQQSYPLEFLVALLEMAHGWGSQGRFQFHQEIPAAHCQNSCSITVRQWVRRPPVTIHSPPTQLDRISHFPINVPPRNHTR